MAKILDPEPDTDPKGPAEAPLEPPPANSEIGRRWAALGGAQRWRPGSDLERMRGRTGQYQSFLDNQSLHGVLTIVWTPETGVHHLTGDIRQAWGSGGAERNVVGCPTSDELVTHDGVGRFQTFERGMYVWHPDTGAHEVHGAILDRYGALGGSAFGYPTTDEGGTPDGRGRFNHFRNVADGGEASIYWTAQTGVHEVYGLIRQAWSDGGWETGLLGYPTSHEDNTHDSAGRYQVFEGGVYAWHPELGAFAVHGPIYAKYNDLNGSWYGYPLHDVASTSDGRGQYLHVRVPGSGDRSIYWTPETGAHTVWGAIRDAWSSYGSERSLLGYPTMDESGCQPGDGAYQTFENGMFVWHASTGAHEVHGDIYGRYSALGGSHFGYPTTDERDAKGGGRFNHFLDVATGDQRAIYWTPELDAVEVTGAIRQRWEQLRFERGHLGYPTAPAAPWAGAPRGEAGALEQQFQGGQVLFTPTLGAAADPMHWLYELPDGGIDGHVEATAHYDGRVDFHAYVKGSSWQGYNYVIQALLKADNNMAVAFTRKSRVSSTHVGDDRNHHHEPVDNVLVQRNYWAFQNGSLDVREEHSGQVTGVIGDLAEGILKFAVGSGRWPTRVRHCC